MIPGHGGIMDRFDCQFLMATFVNVYISSFIRTYPASPAKILQQVMNSSLIFSFFIAKLIVIFLNLDLQFEARATTSTIQFTS